MDCCANNLSALPKSEHVEALVLWHTKYYEVARIVFASYLHQLQDTAGWDLRGFKNSCALPTTALVLVLKRIGIGRRLTIETLQPHHTNIERTRSAPGGPGSSISSASGNTA